MLVNLFVHLIKIYIYYLNGNETQWHVGIVPPPPPKVQKRGKVNIIGQWTYWYVIDVLANVAPKWRVSTDILL